MDITSIMTDEGMFPLYTDYQYYKCLADNTILINETFR